VIWLGVVAGLASAAVFGVAAVVQADAVRGFGSTPDGLVAFVARSVRDARTMVVVAAYLAGFVLHAVAIWLLPLYLAQSLVAMSLPVTALFSARIEDALGRAGWAAVLLVTGGLVLLGLGSGEPGSVTTSWTFAGLLWAAVLALALLSLAGRRLPGPLLGLVAGLGYAGSAISVRGLGTPVTGPVVLAALAVPTISLVAFWLYSLGMHRTAVPATSAALVVAQTFVPALVGVWLLGDGVRSGWTGVVALGLVLSTAGAVVLAVRTSSAAGTSSEPGPT
jgi:drug/metabolite transporter (DMT)-like permease